MNIVQVRERQTATDHFYIVEYSNGKCRKFNTITKAIAEFCSSRDCTTFTRGYVIIHIWE